MLHFSVHHFLELVHVNELTKQANTKGACAQNFILIVPEYIYCITTATSINTKDNKALIQYSKYVRTERRDSLYVLAFLTLDH